MLKKLKRLLSQKVKCWSL